LNFFKRPAYTLLYINNQQITRLDADRKGVLKGELENFAAACETSGSLPQVIDNFIEQTAHPLGRKVWILYSRLNSSQLSLPSVQVEGVSADILEQALQFEYEALTGETLTKSQLAYQFINEADEMSNFWINTLANDTLTRLVAVLKDGGCQLAGISHTGGLPNLLHKEKVSHWLKLEYWANAIFAVSKNPEQGLQLQIFHPQQNRHWQAEVDTWLAEMGKVEKSEALVTSPELEFLPNIDNTYHLIPEEDLGLWMAGWLLHLVGENAQGIPLLNPKQNINKELFYMVGGGVMALLLCGGNLMWIMYKTNDYTFQAETLEKSKKDSESVRKSLTTSRDELKKLQTKKRLLEKNIQTIPDAITALKNRPAKLLKILAQHSPNDLLLENITLDEQHILISGVTLEAQLSNQLADMIDKPLADLGWKVSSPDKKSLHLFGDDHGPWSFEIMLGDKGLDGFSKSPQVKK